MKKIIFQAVFLLLLVNSPVTYAQDVIDTIIIKDASFKQQTIYWKDCGFDEPHVGLQLGIGRAFKMVRQELTSPLQKNKCYTFSLKLRQSKAGQVGVDFPDIRVWGGNNLCQRSELLAQVGPVAYTDWKTYDFELSPRKDYAYLVIEAYTKTYLNPGPGRFRTTNKKRLYAGHVVMGHISDIYEMKCKEESILPKQKEIVKKAKKTKKIIMPELNKKVSKGQVMRIRNLVFDANSATLLQSGQSVLDELFDFLKENPTVEVELGGYTNNLCDTPYCDSLSEKRAQTVANFLVKKGITAKRITFKGYGKRNPIATNSTPEGRKTNQRVEVKILTQ